MLYFIGRNNQQLGSFSEAQIREKLLTGFIKPDDLLWCEGMADWQAVHTVFGAPTPADVPPPIPTHVSGSTPFRSDITRETTSDLPELAERSTRLIAKSIDGIISIVACVPGLYILLKSLLPTLTPLITGESTAMPTDAITLAITHAFVAFIIPQVILLIVQAILVTRRGQSIGKIWCKIRIVRTDGSPAGFVHGMLLRTIVIQIINNIVGVTALIDPLMIYREDRRCMHDLLADTTVIKA